MANSRMIGRNRSPFPYVALVGLGGLMLAGSGPTAAQPGGIAVGVVGSIGTYGVAKAMPLQDPPEEPSDIARQLMKTGKFAEAIPYWTREIAKRPSSVNAYLNRGICYRETGELDKAIADFSECIQRAPTKADGYIERGHTYTKKNQFGQAIQDLSEYISRRPDDPDAFAIRALAYLCLKPQKFEEASADIDRAIALDPDDPAFVRARLQLATMRYANKDYKGAIDEATKLLAMEGQSKNKVALTIRASSYSDMANANRNDTASLTNAIKDYDVLVQLDPTDATSLRNRGVAFYRLKQFDKAIGDFDGYTKVRPDEPDGYNFKGLAYMQMMPGQYAKAIDAYNAFLERKPGDSIAHYNRGLAYYQTRAYDKALTDFRVASEDKKHPNARDITGYIADCLIRLGKTKEAEMEFTTAIKNNPKDGDAWLSRGAIRLGLATAMKEEDPARKAKLQEALADFNEAVKLLPNQIEPLLNRSLTYFKLGQWDGTIADATAALKIKPDNADALITRADAYFNSAIPTKDKAAFTNAIADYKRYLELPGLMPHQVKSATEGLALALRGRGD